MTTPLIANVSAQVLQQPNTKLNLKRKDSVKWGDFPDQSLSAFFARLLKAIVAKYARQKKKLRHH